MPKSSLGDLLKKARINKGWTQSQLAVECGWLDSAQSSESNSRVANYESGNRTPRTDDLPILAVRLNLSPAELMQAIAKDNFSNESFSKIKAELDVVHEPVMNSTGANSSEFFNKRRSDKEYATISLYADAALSAGPGMTLHDESRIEELAFRKDWLAKKGLFEDKLVAVPCIGNSMEPTIFDGEIVLINTSDQVPRDNKIYAINVGDEALLKRVFRNYDGGYILRSDNAVEADRNVPADNTGQLRVIGRAVWHGGDL